MDNKVSMDWFAAPFFDQTQRGEAYHMQEENKPLGSFTTTILGSSDV